MSLLADELTSLMQRSLTSRVSVQQPGTSGTNPTPTTVATQVPAMLVPANARDAEVKGQGYAHIPTHSALVEANEDIRQGYWVRETHYIDEAREWHPITSSEQRRYLVLGAERVPGMPEPRNQWRLWLWEETSRPLGGD